MRAARNFARNLQSRSLLPQVAALSIDLYGSLAETGRGHGTDVGIMLGLMGEAPDTVVPSSISRLMETIRSTKQLSLWGAHAIAFNPDKAFSYRIRPMVEHPNGMRFQAFDQAGERAAEPRAGKECVRS